MLSQLVAAQLFSLASMLSLTEPAAKDVQIQTAGRQEVILKARLCLARVANNAHQPSTLLLMSSQLRELTRTCVLSGVPATKVSAVTFRLAGS